MTPAELDRRIAWATAKERELRHAIRPDQWPPPANLEELRLDMRKVGSYRRRLTEQRDNPPTLRQPSLFD